MRYGQRIFSLWMAAFLLLHGTSVLATKAPPPEKPAPEAKEYLDNLANAGISYQLTDTTLDLTIDESKVIRALPSLLDAGVVDLPTLTDLQQSSAKITIATVGVIFAAAIMDDAYTSSKTLNQLHVQAYYLPPGSRTAAAKQPCFTFDFSRVLFQKAAWDTLSAKDFMANVPGFTFGAACAKAMAT